MAFRIGSRHGAGKATAGAVVVWSTLVMGSLASAQTPQPTPPPPTPEVTPTPTPESDAHPTTAQGWFRRGENVYRVGRYQEAIDAWERAFELDPRPRIQYNLAQAYERMGRLEDAIAALERYVRDGDPEDLVYADANARLAALRQRVAGTGIVIEGGPAGGAITIDGTSWGVTPRPDRIPLSPGSHAITVTYPDGRVFRSTVATPAGQAIPVVIDDSNITSPEVQLVQVETEAPPSHALLFAGAGAGAVGLFLLGYGIERQVKVGRCEEPGNYCENLDAGQTQRTIGLAAGVTLTAGGAALVIVDILRHRSYRNRHADTALTCAPLLPGATCRLRF